MVKHVVCNIVSLNCCLSTGPPILFNGAHARAKRLVDAFYASIPYDTVDIICLQELVIDYGGIKSRFIHHPYSTKKLNSPWYTNDMRLVSSGLCILSRFEIVEEDAYVFKGNAYHAEILMAKGIIYAKIKLQDGIFVHVFNTHLQAWTVAEANDVRAQQMQELFQFMTRKLLYVDFAYEFVIVGFDSNTDLFEHNSRVKTMFQNAHLNITEPQNPIFSFDPTHNPLVGLDDPKEYRLRGHFFNQDKNKLIEDGQISPVPKQLIDGFATHIYQTDSVQCLLFDVIPIKTRSPFVIHINMSTQMEVCDVSDHAAVIGKFKFLIPNEQTCPYRCLPKNYQKKSVLRENEKISILWVCIFIVIAAILFLLIFYVLVSVFC